MHHTAHIAETRREAAAMARTLDAQVAIAQDGDAWGRTATARTITMLRRERDRWTALRTACFRALGG